MANTRIQNINGRQWPLSATFLVSNLNINDTGVVVPVCKLPPKSIVTSGYIDVLTAWDSTTAAITLGDSVSPTRYLASTSIKTTGKTSLLLPDYVDLPGDDLILTPTITGTATVGSFMFHVIYVVLDRANENQPN